MPAAYGKAMLGSGACVVPTRSRQDRNGGSLLATTAVARHGKQPPSRGQVFAVAAALAATALTGAAAVAGLHRSAPAAPSVPQVGQTIEPAAPAARERVEPGG